MLIRRNNSGHTHAQSLRAFILIVRHPCLPYARCPSTPQDPRWTLDRGAGYYATERVKKKLPCLVQTGKYVVVHG